MWYPLGYTLKVVGVVALLWYCRPIFGDLRARPTALGWVLAVVVGLGVTAVWVGLDGLYPALPFLGGQRIAFDPFTLSTPRGWGSWPCGCSGWWCSSR